VNPYTGGLPKGGPKASATFVREDELQKEKAQRPFPPQARKFYWFIYTPTLLIVAGLPLLLELLGVHVAIGPWLGLLITIPVTVVAMFAVGFLREGMIGNIAYAMVTLFSMTLAYSLEFPPDQTDQAILWRAAAPVIAFIVTFFLWKDLKRNLREWHYRVAAGESWQDILAQMQQANVIQKAGGKPALTENGEVVDAEDLMPRPGFRQKPQKKKGEGKRKKPKLR